MEVDKSMKLVMNQFSPAVTEVPLDVYHQVIPSDMYSSSGFQFNIKQPGTNALLDCDIWVRYTFLLESANNEIQDGLKVNNAITVPQDHKIALRGGNIAARCLQNLNVQINNQTLNVQPYKYMDVLNRLYVSNDQSEHEFSASGGRFDEGDHSLRSAHTTFTMEAQTNAVAGAAFNIYFKPTGYNSVAAAGAYTTLRPRWPLEYEFYNPGFSRRFSQFAYNARTMYSRALEAQVSAIAPNANPAAVQTYPGLAAGVIAGTANPVYIVEVYERLPIPCFKMYSTDGTYGVIPNIVQMQIQGNFLSSAALRNNLFRGYITNDGNVNVVWPAGMPQSQAKLYLKWYTPPINFSIPREISIPYPKINTWSTTFTISAPPLNASNTTTDISQYNVTLEAIPDLLLIYVKQQPFTYLLGTPDDCLLEIQQLTLNIDNASGKMNQVNSLEMYQKWKKLIKHSDSKIIGYEEWRKFCYVACLQPEDYGCRYGPGYSNQTTLGFTGKLYNWNVSPSILTAGDAEQIGGAVTTYEIFITSIYNKNRLIIRADGTANQDLLKVAADFNMLAPNNALPPASI